MLEGCGFSKFHCGELTIIQRKAKYDYKSKSIRGGGAYPLAADRGQICKTPPGAQSLAGGKYVNTLFRFVGLDDLEHSNLLLDHACAGVPSRRIPDADLYHFP